MTDNRTAVTVPAGPAVESRRWGLGLQIRFTVIVLCLTLAVASLAGVLVAQLAGDLTSRQAREQSLLLSSLLAKGAAGPLLLHDSNRLQWLMEEYCADNPVLFVTITDPKGSPVATAGPSSGFELLSVARGKPVSHDGMLGTPVFVERQDGLPAYLRVTYPINAPDTADSREGVLLGYVTVGLDVQRTMHDLATAVNLFSGVSVLVLIVAVPLAFLVVRFVVVPLKEVSRAVNRFAGGDYSARSNVHGSDEIGELSSAFNAMADELSAQHERVVALNAELEARVEERTRQLHELASREPLTGLYNRRHFNEVIVQRFSEAIRYGAELSCVMIDLDDFKAVNDQFGHQVGDEVLILMATTISSQLRAADLAARFGGDEFIILLPRTPADRAQVLGERIVRRFTEDVAEQLPQVRVSLSVGIANLPETSTNSPDGLLRAADQALYQAKSEGKNRIVMAAVPV